MPIDHVSLHFTLYQSIRQCTLLLFAILAHPRLRLRRQCPLRTLLLLLLLQLLYTNALPDQLLGNWNGLLPRAFRASKIFSTSYYV